MQPRTLPISNPHSEIRNSDVLILGAGAAGLFCAITAGKSGKKVTVLEHNRSVGEKIRISGGGRCNFTNLSLSPSNFLSRNPHFCTSALARYTQHDFIRLVEQHNIAYHEKKDGQLFCDDGAGKVIDMLLRECREAGVEIVTGCEVEEVTKKTAFEVEAGNGQLAGGRKRYTAPALVVATGGLSIPKLGASGLGYDIARQFGLPIIEPRPGLVPFTVEKDPRIREWSSLSGNALRVRATQGDAAFTDDMLVTHRGLSGPAILQLSSYWDGTGPVTIDLLPDTSLEALLAEQSGKTLKNAFDSFWPKRFAQAWLPPDLGDAYVRTLSRKKSLQLEAEIHNWDVQPAGTEGFAKAEVTAGGVDTNALSSKTMEARDVRGLFFIGEVVDVTGWLGGYNFQWAWSSGFAAGSHL